MARAEDEKSHCFRQFGKYANEKALISIMGSSNYLRFHSFISEAFLESKPQNC